MSEYRFSWMQPKDEYVGVPYLFDGDNHPLRHDGQWIFQARQVKAIGSGSTHPIIGPDYKIAEISGNSGFCLLEPSGSVVGVYKHLDDGYLIHLDKSVRGRRLPFIGTEQHEKLGALFAASCIAVLEDKILKKQAVQVRTIGTYSPAGLKTSMDTHDILVAYARDYRGEDIHPDVIAKMNWAPTVVSKVTLTDSLLKELQKRAGNLNPEEQSVVLAFLAGSNGQLKLVSETGGRKLGYAFESSDVIYDGFYESSEDKIKVRIASAYRIAKESVRLEDVEIAKLNFPLAGCTNPISRIDMTSDLQRIVSELRLDQPNKMNFSAFRKLRGLRS